MSSIYLFLLLSLLLLLLLLLPETLAAKKSKRKVQGKVIDRDNPNPNPNEGSGMEGQNQKTRRNTNSDSNNNNNNDSNDNSNNNNSSNSSSSSIPTVNISRLEYCEGCRASVLAYSQELHIYLQTLQAKGVPQYDAIDAQHLIEGICDKEEHFGRYNMAIKHSCIKLFADHQIQFVEAFQGNSSAHATITYSEVYSRSRRICVDVADACPAYSFDMDSVPISNRSTCRACEVIAHDLDVYLQVTNKRNKKSKQIDRQGDRQGDRPIEEALEEVCQRLGYLHQPFAWLETVCLDLLEERAEQIGDIKKFYDKVKATGLTPNKRLSGMICDEIYSCDKEGSRHRRGPKGHGSSNSNTNSNSKRENDNIEL